MGSSASPLIPPPPTGFKLDGDPTSAIPPPPPGFTLDRDTSADPSALSQLGTSLMNLGKGFLESMASTVDPMMQLKQARDVIDGHIYEAKKAIEHLGHGEVGPAAVHTFNAALPIAGPMLGQLGLKGSSVPDSPTSTEVPGNRPWEMITDVAAPILLGKAAVKFGPPMARAASKFTGIKPARALTRALSPPSADSSFVDTATERATNIKNADTSQPVTDTKGIERNAQLDIGQKQAALETWMDRGRKMGLQISGQPIVQATIDAVPETLKLEDPGAAVRLVQEARNAYGHSPFDVDTLRQIVKEKNAELNAFYDRGTDKQAATVTAGRPQAIVKAQLEAAREALYNALDPDNSGAGPRQLQADTGGSIHMRDLAEHRTLDAEKEKPVTPMGGVAKFLTNLVKAPISLAQDKPTVSFRQPLSGTIDPLVKRAFDALPYRTNKLPLPKPFQAAGLLTPGSTQMPPGPSPPAGPPNITVLPWDAGAASRIANGRLLPRATPGTPEPLITEPPSDFQPTERGQPDITINTTPVYDAETNKVVYHAGDTPAARASSRAKAPVPKSEPFATLTSSQIETVKRQLANGQDARIEVDGNVMMWRKMPDGTIKRLR